MAKIFTHRQRDFIHRHSLGIASVLILISWIVLYSLSDQSTHIGSFFGNAIADWTGVVVMVLATTCMYEVGSAESRRPPGGRLLSPVWELIRNHSLTIFLLLTGIVWVIAYAMMNSESKWGQVVGNIVSEWTQSIGLVLLTKKLIETGSKESDRQK